MRQLCALFSLGKMGPDVLAAAGVTGTNKATGNSPEPPLKSQQEKKRRGEKWSQRGSAKG